MQKTVKFENRAFIPSRFKEKSHIYEHCGRKQSVESKDHSANGGKINGMAVIFFYKQYRRYTYRDHKPGGKQRNRLYRKGYSRRIIELCKLERAAQPNEQSRRCGRNKSLRDIFPFLSDSGIMIRNMAVSVIIPDCTPVLMRQKLAEKTEKSTNPDSRLLNPTDINEAKQKGISIQRREEKKSMFPMVEINSS